MILFFQNYFFVIFLALFLSFPLSADTREKTGKMVPSEKGDVIPELKVISSSKKSSVIEKKSEEESDRIFRRDLILQINEIVKKIQNNYPVLSDDLTVGKQKLILKSLVKTFNHGMEYISAGELAVSEEKIKPNKDVYPAIMLDANKILYIRIDSFSVKMLQQVKKDCENSAEFTEKVIGIVVDLRNSQGYNWKSAVNSAALFLSETAMDKLKLKSSVKQTLKQPVILLTGEKTQGAAEIFTKVMIKSKRAISLGERSAGIPFRKSKFTLSNGDYLMIPQIPELLKDILPAPVRPSITSTPYPQLNFQKLKDSPGTEKGDKCIQRAVELIICLNALKK
jgi:C-terminal processing protease CtpA/Prc